MDLQLVSLEIGACLLGIVVLLVDLWTPAERKAQLGWWVAGGLVAVLLLFGFYPKLITDKIGKSNATFEQAKKAQPPIEEVTE